MFLFLCTSRLLKLGDFAEYLSNIPYLLPFRCHYPLITYLTDTQWQGNDKELFLAVNYNDVSAVKEALEKGRNQNFIHPKFGWTSIHHAAKLGYTEVIKALLSKSGSNPNVKDRFDETPLHYAVVNGHRDIVEFLASNGADVVQEFLDT